MVFFLRGCHLRHVKVTLRHSKHVGRLHLYPKCYVLSTWHSINNLLNEIFFCWIPRLNSKYVCLEHVCLCHFSLKQEGNHDLCTNIVLFYWLSCSPITPHVCPRSGWSQGTKYLIYLNHLHFVVLLLLCHKFWNSDQDQTLSHMFSLSQNCPTYSVLHVTCYVWHATCDM